MSDTFSIRFSGDTFKLGSIAGLEQTGRVGEFDGHSVKVTTASIRLDQIKSTALPLRGFRTVTTIRSSLDDTANRTLELLKKGNDLDVAELLGRLKTTDRYVSRLSEGGILSKGTLTDKQKMDGQWIFKSALGKLGPDNRKAILSVLNSGKMGLVLEALTSDGGKDAKVFGRMAKLVGDLKSALSEMVAADEKKAVFLAERDAIAREVRSQIKADLLAHARRVGLGEGEVFKPTLDGFDNFVEMIDGVGPKGESVKERLTNFARKFTDVRCKRMDWVSAAGALSPEAKSALVSVIISTPSLGEAEFKQGIALANHLRESYEKSPATHHDDFRSFLDDLNRRVRTVMRENPEAVSKHPNVIYTAGKMLDLCGVKAKMNPPDMAIEDLNKARLDNWKGIHSLDTGRKGLSNEAYEDYLVRFVASNIADRVLPAIPADDD